MSWSLYLNKYLNEFNIEAITLSFKNTIDGSQIGEIYKLPASAFFTMVDKLKSSQANPVIYVSREDN